MSRDTGTTRQWAHGEPAAARESAIDPLRRLSIQATSAGSGGCQATRSVLTYDWGLRQPTGRLDRVDVKQRLAARTQIQTCGYAHREPARTASRVEARML